MPSANASTSKFCANIIKDRLPKQAVFFYAGFTITLGAMIHLIKIALFLLVNLGGYNVINLTVWMAATLGIFPALPPGQELEDFKALLFEGGFVVWAICALASTGYFVVPHRELRTWLILAPLYGTFLYAAGLMVYFNFKHLIL